MASARRKPISLETSRSRPTRAEFGRLIREALAHLHDPIYLQTHPLAPLAPLEIASRPPDLGRNLHQSLLGAIEDLRPDSGTAPSSPRARSHQLLVLRYLEALEIAQVQRQLGIGKSQYFFEHQRALEAVASLLWERWGLAKGTEAPADVERTRSHESTGQVQAEQQVGGPRHNLPLQLTSFVGRAREISEVSGLLASARLLTLTGAGGCGKTRLALEVAAGLLDQYPEGVWVVELAALSDPELVPQAVAATLGVREQPGRPIVETLLDHLRARRCLLLLDNCEHLIDACASLVAALLRACPELRVLATSRETLGVPGELAWRVPSLELPQDGQLSNLGRLAECESVRLFLDRADRVRPGFALTRQNAPALAEVCRRLDGMPLAIELAAARVGGLTVEQIGARLDDRFRLLTAGSRTASERQRTLRATIDWSHDLLAESERVLFHRLAVFAGGFTLEAAEAVGGRPLALDDLLESLLQLVNKSLVLTENAGVETRYRLLETIGQYALEKLVASGEEPAVRAEHAAYFLSLAEEGKLVLHGPREREWLDRLDRERDNLRAAMRWLEAVGGAERGLRLATGLFSLWMQRGPYGEAVARLGALLHLPGAKETSLGVEALANLATFTAISVGHHDAQPIGEEALRLGRALGDRRALAWALYAMGGIEGDPEADRRYHSEALELFREVGDQSGSARTLVRLGHVAECLGDVAVARSHNEEGLSIYRELGDLWSIGTLLHKLAMLALLQGDLSEAWELLEESRRYLDEAGDRTYVAWPILFQARVLRLRGEYERARDLAQRALSLGEELGNPTQAADALDQLGLIASARGELGLARRHHEANLARGLERHNRFDVAWTLANLGLVARAEGDYEHARRQIAGSLATMRELGVRREIAGCLGNLGVVALNESHLEEAESLFRESLALRRELGDKGGLATLLECFAGLAALRDQPERALRLAGASARVRDEIGNVAPPVWRRQRDPWLERARQALDPARAEAVWAEGQAMSLEEAVECALVTGPSCSR